MQPLGNLLAGRTRNILSLVPSGLLLLAFTFPVISPYYGPGLDPPLAWVFNTIVEAGNDPGKDFVFPHGPLSFLMYPLPTGHHLFIALALTTLLKFVFFVQVSWLYGRERAGRQLLAFAAVYAAFLLFEIQFLMLGVIAASFALFLRSGKGWLILLPACVTVLAVYMRAYITVTATASLVMFALILYFRFHRRREALAATVLFAAGTVVTWLSLYGTFSGLPDYLKARVVLSLDNSSAVAYYPDNQPWLLAISLLALFGIPLLVKDARVSLLTLFFLPALFAQWKYSMAREDVIHARGFVVFLFLFFILLAPLVKRRRHLTFVLALISIGSYYANLRSLPGYFEWTMRPLRLNEGIDFVMRYDELEKRWLSETKQAIAGQRVGDSLRQVIGSSTLDCYPWDYSYIPANNFHWQPRPALQSYAAYTSWLDGLDAAHFNGPRAPQFLLWHLAGPPGDRNGCLFESLDNRYLLNDEPQTVLEFIRAYSVHSRTDKWLLFEKRAVPLVLQQTILQEEPAHWNQWIRVPAAPGALVRLRATIKTSFTGALKSFLYKGEAVYILLRTADGEVFVFRTVPANAADGLWINPLILQPGGDGDDPVITEILFASSAAKHMQSSIPLEWEAIQPQSGDAGFLDEWLNRRNASVGPCYSSRLKEDKLPAEGWHAGDGNAVKSGYLTAPSAWETAPHGYSARFECRLDTLSQLPRSGAVEVRAGAWTKCTEWDKAGLAISLEDNGTFVYSSTGCGEFAFEAEGWKYVTNTVVLQPEQTLRPGVRLKVLVWNDSDRPMRIDDLQVTLRRR